MCFKIKRISNDSIGTHYGVFFDETLVHFEFSRSAAESILIELQAGKILGEVITARTICITESTLQIEIESQKNKVRVLERQLREMEQKVVKPQAKLNEESSVKSLFQPLNISTRKIEYDPALYRVIANLRINEIVQVTNRKGYKSTIHITNITKLTWHQLQLIVVGGSSKFEKMYLLYKQYSTEHQDNNVLKGLCLSRTESTELQEYIDIFKANGFSKHTQVNENITEHGLWDRFPTIRSLNDHGEYKDIEGIEPKYFEIVCCILNISGEGGRALDNFKKY
ncbi:MAG: hypothetical protein HRT68_15360 [Flavobacteriaceae bacterium]|nr:hypothetical protein [Flavobacteriaceae bacterium]